MRGFGNTVKTICVRNLSYPLYDDLRAAFEAFGEVASATIDMAHASETNAARPSVVRLATAAELAGLAHLAQQFP